MSSFHTVDHSAYWSSGPDQLVEDALHEQAAATFYRGANAPVTVSLDLLRDEVTHVSQSQNLDSIFADVLDELLPITGVGHGDLGTSAGASNLAFGNSHNIPDTGNYTHADFLGVWLTPTPQSDTPASTPSDAAAWDRHVFQPDQPVTEPQDNFLPCSFATSLATWPSHADLAWPFESNESNGPTPLYAHENWDIGQIAATLDGGVNAPMTSQDHNRIFAPALNDWLPNVGVGLGDYHEATSAGVSNPEFENSQSSSETYNQMNKDFLGAWLAPTPPLTMSDTPASTPSDTAWEGDVFQPAQLVTEPQGEDPLSCSSATLSWRPHMDLAWPLEPGQFNGPTPLYAHRDGGMMDPYFDFSHNDTSWGSAKVSTTPLGVANISHGGGYSLSHAAKTLASQRTSLGKRSRSEELTGYGPEKLSGDQRPRPSKKVKGKTVAGGVLEAAGSTSRAPLKSATKTPIQISGKSEAAGRGAGMLAAPNAHEVYHQFLPGPSVQKELVGTYVQGELPWVEGSEEAIRHYASDVVQQQILSSNAGEGEIEDGERTYFRIPRRLGQRHRSLLNATSDDLARGTVRELKCRLCPDAGFSNWEGFKRHCKCGEAHPQKIRFCQYCGDFFARKDSLKRHQDQRPPECYNVDPAVAEAKRTAVKQDHDDFKERLKEYLRTNEGTLRPFSQMTKVKIPDSLTSKRGSRQQCRIKTSRA